LLEELEEEEKERLKKILDKIVNKDEIPEEDIAFLQELIQKYPSIEAYLYEFLTILMR
jgi:hypothetical protein